MPVRRTNTPASGGSSRRPATTPEGRENQLIDAAIRLAERQLEDGTASAQVISHYLKLGSTRERLEQARLEGEVRLQEAKIEAMGSTKRLEAMYQEAMDALRGYQGRPAEENFDDEA